MDQIVLQLLQDCVNARTRAMDRIAYWEDRSEIAHTILEQESRILTMIGTIMNRQRIPLTLTFPINMDMANMDNVIVAPTAEQVNHELVPLDASSQQTCSICQDAIQADGCQLRGCQHSYHRACIQVWFSTSVRCPVCRRDIREDPESQTSSESQ
jgi:hypothetical protein